MVEKLSNKAIAMSELISKEYRTKILEWNRTDGNRWVSLGKLSSYDRRYPMFGHLVGKSENVLGTCKMSEDGKYQIVLSEELLNDYVSYETLLDIALHELAHFINLEANRDSGHGESFKKVCKFLGVTNDSAFMKESKNKEIKTLNSLEKIKKLLALSESSNVNEANSALMKAKELMREYGITRNLESEENSIYRVKLTDFSNLTAELNTIQYIVSEISNVWILISHNSIDKSLYAHGTRTECEVASYLFGYLKKELNSLLMKAKKDSGDNSKGFRTSFYNGVRSGFYYKLQEQKALNAGTEMVVYNNENRDKAKEIIYNNSRITSSNRTNYTSNSSGFIHGKSVGSNLKIRNGISSGKSSGNGTLYLS